MKKGPEIPSIVRKSFVNLTQKEKIQTKMKKNKAGSAEQ